MDRHEAVGGGLGDEPEAGPDSPEAIALGRVFELHFDELYRFAYRYVRSAETAKDLVNESFFRLWRQRAQVDLGAPTARSYLYTTVRYLALDHLRRRRVQERWQGEDQSAGPTCDPSQELIDRETTAAIQDAVNALPPRQREVLQLRWKQQASYGEIAKTLGISPKTVAIHLGRAFQRLRALLGKAR
jgi:RNA polymerase sigma-70 factor (ECF subfamily)